MTEPLTFLDSYRDSLARTPACDFNFMMFDPVNSYDRSFAPVLSQVGARSIVDLIRTFDGGTYLPHVVDLMSYGALLREVSSTVLPISGVALALSDPRTDFQRALDKTIGIELLTGNILNRDAWNVLSERSQRHGRSGFDVVICRPEGPKVLYGNLSVAGILLKRALAITQPQGIAIAQLPWIPVDGALIVREYLSRIPGVYVDFKEGVEAGRNAILIDKTKAPPIEEWDLMQETGGSEE